MAIYGYARVSTADQHYRAQIDALERYGCTRIYSEKISGRKKKRTELDKLLTKVSAGDILVVWKLDRLGRTTQQLIQLTNELREKNITFVSLQDNIDTNTPLGRFYFTIMAGLAEMEVDLIRERTLAGLEAAKKRGRIGGRPKISTQKRARIVNLYFQHQLLPRQIADELKVSETTVRKYINHEKQRRKTATV